MIMANARQQIYITAAGSKANKIYSSDDIKWIQKLSVSKLTGDTLYIGSFYDFTFFGWAYNTKTQTNNLIVSNSYQNISSQWQEEGILETTLIPQEEEISYE